MNLWNEILFSLSATTLGFELLVFIGSVYFAKHNITFLVLLFLSSRIICAMVDLNIAHSYIAMFSPVVFALLVTLKKDYLSTKRLIPACAIVVAYIIGVFFSENLLNELHSIKIINQHFAYSDVSFLVFLALMVYVVILRKINNFECFLQGAYIASYIQFLVYYKFEHLEISYFELGSFIFLVAIAYQGYKLAFYDALTNVYNRRAYEAAQVDKGDFIAIVDIDFFKRINDTHGHDTGDIILSSVAKILKKYTKTYRYGGEEFALIFKHTSEQDCLKALHSINKEIQEHTFIVKQIPIKLTVSIGLCLVSNSKFGAFETADKRLYQAKQNGRNQVVYV